MRCTKSAIYEAFLNVRHTKSFAVLRYEAECQMNIANDPGKTASTLWKAPRIASPRKPQPCSARPNTGNAVIFRKRCESK
jgi:hypothetical protein